MPTYRSPRGAAPGRSAVGTKRPGPSVAGHGRPGLGGIATAGAVAVAEPGSQIEERGRRLAHTIGLGCHAFRLVAQTL